MTLLLIPSWISFSYPQRKLKNSLKAVQSTKFFVLYPIFNQFRLLNMSPNLETSLTINTGTLQPYSSCSLVGRSCLLSLKRQIPMHFVTILHKILGNLSLFLSYITFLTVYCFQHFIKSLFIVIYDEILMELLLILLFLNIVLNKLCRIYILKIGKKIPLLQRLIGGINQTLLCLFFVKNLLFIGFQIQILLLMKL